MVEVFGSNEQSDVEVDLDRLVALARYTLAEEGVRGDVEVGMLLVDEATIAELNRQHMGEEGPTDVLAFPIDDEYVPRGRQPDGGLPAPENREPPTSAGPLLLGDIVICPAVADRNAAVNAGSRPGHLGRTRDELDLLVVHGLLHVLGHEHASEADAAVMRGREAALLAGFGDWA
jgi:probable rRNA maturation factor